MNRPPRVLLVSLALAAFSLPLEAQTIGKISPALNWDLPGKVTFSAPAGSKGWYNRGFRRENDGTINALTAAGVCIDLKKNREVPLELEITLRIPPIMDRQEYVAQTTTKVRVAGSGDQHLFVPWSAFDFQQATPAFLKFLQSVEIAGKYDDGAAGKIEISQVAPARGENIALEADIRSHALQKAGSATYAVKIFNSSNALQTITLNMQRYGWEAMPATVSPIISI